MNNKKHRPVWVGILVSSVLLVLLVPVVSLILAWRFLYWLVLLLVIWLRWCMCGRRVLFVYSNSPIWQNYIEQGILPRLPERSIVMNWSERGKWNRFTLPAQAFFCWGGGKKFNPLGVVFRPFHMPLVFRFWEPFIEYKHGKPEALIKLEPEMFESILNSR